MHSLIRRAVVAGGAVAVVLGTGAGVAGAAPVPSLAWSPSGTVSFGKLAPGATSAPVVFTLKNTGGAASSALTITLTPGSGFKKTADTCTGTSLGPGKSCTVRVTYTAPATPGQSSGATLKAAGVLPGVTASVTLTGAAKATPVITTTQQPTGVPEELADQATVTGGDNPTGVVTFALYNAPNCGSVVETISRPLPPSGVLSVTGGASYIVPGTVVYWVATYNGDDNNNAVSTGCNDEPVSIVACLVTNTTTGHSYTDLADAAAAATAGDTLHVAGTCTGTTEIGKDVTLTGTSTDDTLDGDGQPGSVLTIDSGVAVTINALTITGGTGGTSGEGAGLGGGIFNQGTLTLNNVRISGNTAGQGGGIYNFQVPGASPGATVTLAGSTTITGNTATGGPNNEGAIGGGIFNFCGTLVNAIGPPAADANVHDNTPDDIVSECT